MSNVPPQVVLYLGPEEGKKRSAVAELRKMLGVAAGDDIDHDTFYAFETSADHVVQTARNGGLFSSGRFIRYRGVEELSRKEALAPLLEYVKTPSPNTVLVLESSAVSVARDLERAVGANAKRVFWEMFEDEKHGWLTGFFRRHSVPVEDGVVETLIEQVDNTTTELRAAANRLIQLASGPVTVELVEQVVYHSRPESIFTLFDALVASKLTRSLDIATTLLITEHATRIIGGISWQLERAYALARLAQSGVPAGQLFQEYASRGGRRVTGKRTQAVLTDAIARWSVAELAASLALAVESDSLLRSVGQPLHETIVTLCVYGVAELRGRWTFQPDLESTWPEPVRVARRLRV